MRHRFAGPPRKHDCDVDDDDGDCGGDDDDHDDEQLFQSHCGAEYGDYDYGDADDDGDRDDDGDIVLSRLEGVIHTC